MIWLILFVIATFFLARGFDEAVNKGSDQVATWVWALVFIGGPIYLVLYARVHG
jgi:hypothetical protein